VIADKWLDVLRKVKG